MKRFFRTAVLMCVLVLPLSGCDAFRAAWPVVKSVIDKVSDAEQILDLIAVHAAEHFRKHPDDEKQARFTSFMIATRSSLNVATRTTKGVDHLTKEEEHAAFADFREAFGDLRSLLGSYGIMGADGVLGASVDGKPIVVPEPLAMTP